MTDPVVYLMRGLPASGKSFTARTLAGPSGIVLETDAFFYTQVGTDPTKYDWSDALLPTAQAWNFARFEQALAQRVSPIIVDRGNGLNPETRRYAALAIAHGYRVELKEPESDWWREIRKLLADKAGNATRLQEWADRLAEVSQATHRVPVTTIRRWMNAWRIDLRVEDIVQSEPLDSGERGIHPPRSPESSG